MKKWAFVQGIIGVFIACLILFFSFLILLPSKEARAHGNALPVTPNIQATSVATDPTTTALEKSQLRLEVEESEHNLPNWIWANTSTLISTLALAFAGLFGVLRWLRDRRAQREREADQDFQLAIKALSSRNMSKKIGATIMLRTFLRSNYEQFYSQIFDLVTAQLRLIGQVDLNTSSSVLLLHQNLIGLFRETFPRARDWLMKQHDPSSLYFPNAPLNKIDLAGSDLSSIWMPGSALREADLRSANLSNANLRDAKLVKARLNLATLTNANLTGADLTETTLEQAEMPEVILDQANLTRANLAKANLAKATLIKTNLTESILERAIFSGAIFEGANLTRANLVGANLTNAVLVGQVNFSESNLSNAKLTDVDLTGADLTRADLTGTDPDTAKSLVGTKMNGVTGLSQNMRDACIAKGAIF